MDQRISQYPPADYEIPRPKNFDKMLEFASLLSKGFAHVRVDFYEVRGKLYFEEMTFTSESGLTRANPMEFELEMGEWLVLPAKSEIPRIK